MWSSPNEPDAELRAAAHAVLHDRLSLIRQLEEMRVAAATSAMNRAQLVGPYTIEPHGDGYALYSGRDQMHHGFNLARITEATPETLQLIEQALNAEVTP